ncbi:MAG: ABC transporter substrate-binding protein [Chloroflexi bacterium]|nr:ABC transporter substrate-binding protein [Chloroflexota bacterium]
MTAKRALSKALSRRMILRSGAAAVAGGVGAAALAACGEAEVVEKTVTVTVTEVKEVVKEVPVETVVTKEVVKEVPVETVVTKEVIKEVPVVEVKEVEVEKVVTQEKVVEVQVEKVVEREKVVEVMAQNPKADSLVIANPQTQKVDDLDGSQVYEFQTKIHAFCTSESLLLYDYQTQTLKPRLAESWEVAPDATSVTFTLREGVTWHNGDPFTPEDVVFNFNRIFRDDDPYHAEGTFYYNGFAQPFYGDTEVLDGRTVRVNLTQPDALAAEKFGALDSSYMAHPPSVMEHGNREYSTDPDKYVGTGPYIPVEVRPAELVRMVRNENWWGPQPDFKELIFRIFPGGAAGADARVNALLAGEVDVALYTPATRRNDLFRTPGIGAKWFPNFVLGYFYINHTFPLFQDNRVRQAVARSFDRVSYYEATAGPTVLPWGRFWFPGSPYLNDAAELDYDPAQVASLMQDAGFSMGGDGVWANGDMRAEFKIQYRGDPGAPPDRETFWMQGLNDQGFSVELEAWDPAIGADFDNGPFAQQNLHLGGWGVGVFLGDPAFAYQRWTAGDLFSRSYMDNAEMNQLYQDILVEADADNRTSKVHRMQEIAADQVAWIPATVSTLGAAWREEKVTNVTSGATQYSYPWLYKVAPV